MNLGPHLARLPAKYRWTLHNLLGHPLSEVFHLLGLSTASEWIHDVTMPDDSGPPEEAAA